MGLGSFLQGLAPLTSGYYQGKDELMRRQMLEYQQQRQKQTDQGLVQWAQALADSQQQPIQPLTPPPGQQSQPMQPPQGQPPQGMQPPPQMPPGMMPGRQMGPPQQQMGPPPQQAPQAPQVKPYTSPQAPQTATPQQQMPQAQALGPPPQDQQPQVRTMSLEEMAHKLKSAGLEGMGLYSAIQAHQGFLDSDSKRQLAQLTAEVKQMQAEAAQTRAGADVTRAATGAAGEERRQESAQGGNAMSAAKIEQMKAMSQAALARARRASSSGVSVSSEDFDILAKGLVTGDVSPKDLSQKDGFRERVIAQAKRLDPNYDSKAYNAGNAFGTAEARAGGAGLGKVEFAIQDMQEIAPLISEASAKVPRSSFMPINKLISEYNSGVVQDPAQRQLAVYINSMLNSYDMLAARGGTDKDKRAQVRGLLTKADSQEALKAGVDAFMQEAKAAERAGKKTKDIVAPKGGKAPEDDQDKQALEWANANPNDPRAKQIKQHLGM